MTEKLSNTFYGNKKFKKNHYQTYMKNKNISDQEVCLIFSPYTQHLSNVKQKDGDSTLLCIFSEFIRENLKKFRNFPFQKLSTWIQMSAHIFEHSFEAHLTKKQSFQYFTDLSVRHSLFRPPHSICIFDFEELKQIMNYWCDTFNRFYEQYAECFMKDENRILKAKISGFPPAEMNMKMAKEFDREELSKIVDFVNSKVEQNKNEQN